MRRITAVLIVTLLALSANAQQSIATGQFDPSMRNLARTTEPQVALTFTSDEKTAKVQLGDERDDMGWAIAIAGPIDEDNDRTRLATAEGLNDSVNAEFTAKYKYHSEHVPFTTTELVELCTKFRADPNQNCDQATRQQLNARGQEIFDEGLGWHLIFSGSAKWGTKKFEFADAETFADDDARKNGWSVAGATTWITQFDPRWLYSATLSLRHESAWKAQDPATLCEPQPNTAVLKCREKPFGAPGKETKRLITLETRHFISQNTALVPRAKWEIEEGEYSFELPFYVRQDDGPFNGGVSIAWDSTNHDFVVGVFVGALATLD